MKSSIHDLRIFGGETLFPAPVHVGQPNLLRKEQLEQRMSAVLSSGQLTNHGPQVRQLEERLSSLLNVRNAVAVCNATTGLQILAKALNLSGEIIMPSFTFIATAHAMDWIGLTPVFADIDPVTHTLCPSAVRRCLSANTSAILGVHVWGNLCDVESLQAIADTHSLPLIFDACHAFGSAKEGRPAGQFGRAEVFSLHATKLVHSLEGGIITTNDDELAARCRRLRNFGITGLTEVSDIGINGKMHELSAAAGLHSLEDLQTILAVNLRNRGLWAEQLEDVSGLSLLPIPHGQQPNHQYVAGRVDSANFGLTRDQLITVLRSEGLFARSYFVPGCHRSSPYCQHSLSGLELPVTETILQDVFQLPTGLAVEHSVIVKTGQLLKFVESNSRDILEEMLTRSALGHHPLDPVYFNPARAESQATRRELGQASETALIEVRSHSRHEDVIPEPHLGADIGLDAKADLNLRTGAY